MSSAAQLSHSSRYVAISSHPPRSADRMSRAPALGGEPARGSSWETTTSRRENESYSAGR